MFDRYILAAIIALVGTRAEFLDYKELRVFPVERQAQIRLSSMIQQKKVLQAYSVSTTHRWTVSPERHFRCLDLSFVKASYRETLWTTMGFNNLGIQNPLIQRRP